MSAYIEPLKTALLFFPFIALVVSVPFILVQYHRYGSVSFVKSLVLYTFVLYFICAYFLVILPLPDKASAYRSPPPNFIPFMFVKDFISTDQVVWSNPATWYHLVAHGGFYCPVFNLFLTMPFGVYLRYYKKVSAGQALLFTFCLSLFYELTQLSGLYFYYPRPYRTFDVDDLMINALGGLVGWWAAKPLIRVLPSREKLNAVSVKKSVHVSGFRRFTAMVLDMVFFCMLFFALALATSRLLPSYVLPVAVPVFYFAAVPALCHGQTPAQRFLNLRVCSADGRSHFLPLLARMVLFCLFYIALPLAAFVPTWLVTKNNGGDRVLVWCFLCSIALWGCFYLCVGIKYVFTGKPMLYEKLSRTKMTSTLTDKN